MMTDEEMAEEYLRVTVCGDNCPDLCEEPCIKAERTKKHFLAGLKAGRPKWHKVADGDLPKEGVEVLNEHGDKVIYDDVVGHQGWIAYSEYHEAYVEVDAPKAWCEIPKFNEV